MIGRIVAYILNENLINDNVRGKRFKDTDILFYINGHFNCCPSLKSIGVIPDHESGAVVGRLAVLGFPIVTFDDRDFGESEIFSVAKNNLNAGEVPQGNQGLIRELADIRAVEKALLTGPDHPYRAIHATGLSGGGLRLMHYLLMNRGPLKSAYIASPVSNSWMELDNEDCELGQGELAKLRLPRFGVNADMFDFSYLSNFQVADHLLAGIDRGIRLVFALNSRESPNQMAWFWHETVPTLQGQHPPVNIRLRERGDTKPPEGKYYLEIGGDAQHANAFDPEGFCHQYVFSDIVAFLRSAMKPQGVSGPQ